MGFYQKEIFTEKIFYHIYPLGAGNCPKSNDYSQPAGNFFEILTGDLDRIRSLGFNALYIGPIFESTRHGYDTIDYYYVDRRLGNNEKFKAFCHEAHRKGFVIVLDAVFNHTGRDFFAFKDIQRNGQNSQYKDWYLNLNFSQQSNYGDSFDYEGWAGCKDLVKLNLKNTAVRNHIFGAVNFWIEEFSIDGLRLDAADVMDKEFLEALGSFCRSKKNDFWLMGEVVHGDYNQWCSSNRIDSVTNYQLYKAIYSSVDNFNFFELSYNLNREFGQQKGIYKYAPLYNFLDNHDVNRIASTIKNPKEKLLLIYALMFAVPGIPSVYYGSEYAYRGMRGQWDDYELRPAVPPFADLEEFAWPGFDSGFIAEGISKLAEIRKNSVALQKGDYREEMVANRQFVFSRNYVGAIDGKKCSDGKELNNGFESCDGKEGSERVLVICNCDDKEALIDAKPKNDSEVYQDMISGEKIEAFKLRNILLEKNSFKFLRKI